MPTDEDGCRLRGRPPAAAERLRLDRVATELYADLRLTPIFRQLLVHSSDLLGTTAGGISLVEVAGDRYAKMAERGASCQLGRSFSLDEGVSGQVLARRRPVVMTSYSDLATGHLPVGHPAGKGAVAAVPIWWRGEVIGANVVFAGRHRKFTVGEVDELEALTQVAAVGIVSARPDDPSLADLIRDHPRQDTELAEVLTAVTEVGLVRAVSPTVAGVAVDLVLRAERAAANREPNARLHVAVVYRPDRVGLFLQDETSRASGDGSLDPLGAAARRWHDLVATIGGGASTERVPGWGTLVRAEFPYEPEATPPPLRDEPPLTSREHEVLALMARGLSNRDLASTLVISPKTAEKHVGAVLRKTGTTSRTAAVMSALERGWLPAAEVTAG